MLLKPHVVPFCNNYFTRDVDLNSLGLAPVIIVKLMVSGYLTCVVLVLGFVF